MNARKERKAAILCFVACTKIDDFQPAKEMVSLIAMK